MHRGSLNIAHAKPRRPRAPVRKGRDREEVHHSRMRQRCGYLCGRRGDIAVTEKDLIRVPTQDFQSWLSELCRDLEGVEESQLERMVSDARRKAELVRQHRPVEEYSAKRNKHADDE